LGRWGGDEFIILCPQTTYIEAKGLSERLRFAFSSYRFEKIVYKTVSFGLALFEDEDTIESLIAKADKALYDSKKLGKNGVN